MAILTRPLFLAMENELAARAGQNFIRMKADLEEAGYALWDVVLNSSQRGLPQDRNRAYFVAPRLGVAVSVTDVMFHN